MSLAHYLIVFLFPFFSSSLSLSFFFFSSCCPRATTKFTFEPGGAKEIARHDGCVWSRALDPTTAASAQPHLKPGVRARRSQQGPCTMRWTSSRLELSQRLSVKQSQAGGLWRTSTSTCPMRRTETTPLAECWIGAGGCPSSVPTTTALRPTFSGNPVACLYGFGAHPEGSAPEIVRRISIAHPPVNYDEQAQAVPGAGSEHTRFPGARSNHGRGCRSPAPRTFQDFMRYVLVIATTMEIVIVGVERRATC